MCIKRRNPLGDVRVGRECEAEDTKRLCKGSVAVLSSTSVRWRMRMFASVGRARGVGCCIFLFQFLEMEWRIFA